MTYKKGFLDNSIRHKDLTRQDKDNLSEWLSEGNFDETVAQIAQACGLMQIVVKNLAKLGNTNYLSALLPHCSEDDLNQNLAKINHEDGSGTTLASALKTFGDNARAGMIFEQLNLYEKAAICFEKALDFDRAAGFRALATEWGQSPARLAHRYALSIDDIGSVILGVKNREELRECLLAESDPRLSADEIEAIDRSCAG